MPNAQDGDQGDYKIVVSNDAGDASSNAPLTVKPEGLLFFKNSV